MRRVMMTGNGLPHNVFGSLAFGYELAVHWNAFALAVDIISDICYTMYTSLKRAKGAAFIHFFHSLQFTRIADQTTELISLIDN